MHALLRGALAGTAATGPMSAVMAAASAAGLLGEHPPESIVRHAARATGQSPPRPTVRALAAVTHLGFGAGVGAGYALLPAVGPPVARGTATALAVYVASYQGWLPALGILPPASDDRPARPTVMVAAHVVFGAVLGLLDDRWREGG